MPLLPGQGILQAPHAWRQIGGGPGGSSPSGLLRSEWFLFGLSNCSFLWFFPEQEEVALWRSSQSPDFRNWRLSRLSGHTQPSFWEGTGCAATSFACTWLGQLGRPPQGHVAQKFTCFGQRWFSWCEMFISRERGGPALGPRGRSGCPWGGGARASLGSLCLQGQPGTLPEAALQEAQSFLLELRVALLAVWGWAAADLPGTHSHLGARRKTPACRNPPVL